MYGLTRTMNSNCDVLLFGDYFCDVIITGLSEVPRLGADLFGQSMEIVPGGGAYITAVWLQHLGVKARWAARLGNDIFSRFIREEAQREGLDTSLFQEYSHPQRCLSLSFSFQHDRGFISYMDPFPDVLPYQALIESQQPRWVVNSPFDGALETRYLVERIHQGGGKVFTDCQYVTTTLAEPGLIELLRQTDVFAPNQSEACQLTGEADPEKALGILAEFCPLVIIKCGAQGAYARAGAQVWHMPALPLEVVDTTGAGDSFNAGFLTGLVNGEPVETCLRYGNICGGYSTTRHGGTNAAFPLEQLKKYCGSGA